MLFGNLKSHLSYVFTEYIYFIKVILFEKNLRKLTFYISLKFLIDAGIKNLLHKKNSQKKKKNLSKP